MEMRFTLSIQIFASFLVLILMETISEACAPVLTHAAEHEVHSLVFARTVCDGRNGFTWEWMKKPEFHKECFGAHELDHVLWLKNYVPQACAGRERGMNPVLLPEQLSQTECHAYKISLHCLARSKYKDTTTREVSFVMKNIAHQESAIASYCK